MYYWGLLNLSVWETPSNLSRHILPWKFAYRVCTISVKKPLVVVISRGGNVAAAHCYVIYSLPSSSHMIRVLTILAATSILKCLISTFSLEVHGDIEKTKDENLTTNVETGIYS